MAYTGTAKCPVFCVSGSACLFSRVVYPFVSLKWLAVCHRAGCCQPVNAAAQHSDVPRCAAWVALVVVLCREFADFYDYAHGLLHRLHGNELIRAVEVYAAGKNVGAGQALE